jgi:hypothetical protein
MLLCIAVVVVILILYQGQIKPGVPVLTVLFLVMSGYGLLGGSFLVIVGACMTGAAPRESRAKRWGIGTGVFSLLTMIVAVVWVIASLDALQRQGKGIAPVDQFGQPIPLAPVMGTTFTPQEVQLIGFAFQGTYLLAVCCFLLCQRAIAKQFGRDGLAVGISFYLLVYVVFFAAMNVLGQTAPAAREIQDIQRALAITLGGYLALEIWGLIVLAMTRGALTKGLLRS